MTLPSLDRLEAALGYRFNDRGLLIEALTHRSYAHDSPDEDAHNERLEFLGDSVLGLIVSQFLVERYPTEAEGRLSQVKSQWVSAEHLVEVARTLCLGNFLRIGRCEEMSGGRQKRALLVNALEAVLAAVYLDGGLEAVRDLVCAFVIPPVDKQRLAPDFPLEDFKGALQEAAQQLKLPHPRYMTVEERGPEHAKSFVIEVRLGPDWKGVGEGTSKKKASQAAARQVLEQLQRDTAVSITVLPARQDAAVG